jgi:hypothetical protein
MRTVLVYIVDWLPPDYGAIGQYALKEAHERAAAGDEVHLIGLTSGPSREESSSHPTGGTLHVVRLHSDPVPRTRLRARAVWTFKTNVRLVNAALRFFPRATEILFTASPPFLEHFLLPLRRGTRARVVFRIADVHPEVLMKELSHVPSWLGLLRQLSVRRRRAVDQLEVLGDDQRRLMEADGVAPDRIVLRRSGLPTTWRDDPPLPRPAPFADRAILLYSGAVGHAHDIATFVAGYAEHHRTGTGRVVFWLNADGGHADEFEEKVRATGAPLHRSKPVPLEQFCALMVTPDAHLITLKSTYEGLVVPSKTYGCIASGKDLLFVGPPGSDVHALASASLGEGYFHAQVGSGASVASALERIADRWRDGQTSAKRRGSETA